ncbi:alpha/beta fold hydrolase [Nocardiopsis algeriensis]|uniref:Pyochelin biosynthetic protein PchC n=1 Tax=Nocardiopsis algeriensis TaxID=1478215 RepID=A0A841IQZ4_9ACTN|nr:pyochelin biosynthetic protein PchC [Nocardiopsis algeriensis]
MDRVFPPESPWLRRFHERRGAPLTLVLFPHAGGTANFYRSWSAGLPPWCELWVVQYPGRETRMSEPLVPRMEELADGAAAALAEHLRGPYALFGHSMGSAVAYETARRLSAGPAGGPVHFFASGRSAPTRPVTSRVHEFDDDALVESVVALGVTPPEVFDVPGFREMVLSVVRNDYRLIETYRPADTPPLEAPVTALAGDDDPLATPDDVKEWAGMTTRGCTVEVLPGGHFFPVRHQDEVLGILARDLAPHLRS